MSTQGEMHQPQAGWANPAWRIASIAATTVQRPGLLEMAGFYLGGADPRSPLAAPIYADLKGLAPLLIQVGAAETLLDDAIRWLKPPAPQTSESICRSGPRWFMSGTCSILS
jgi:acetyl esterase/lipase